MIQDEVWVKKYKVISFIETTREQPKERGLYLNWIKHNRKMMHSGKMKKEKVEKFNQILELIERYKHVNQWV